MPLEERGGENESRLVFTTAKFGEISTTAASSRGECSQSGAEIGKGGWTRRNVMSYLEVEVCMVMMSTSVVVRDRPASSATTSSFFWGGWLFYFVPRVAHRYRTSGSRTRSLFVDYGVCIECLFS